VITSPLGVDVPLPVLGVAAAPAAAVVLAVDWVACCLPGSTCVFGIAAGGQAPE
jgi:hypothetical protein